MRATDRIEGNSQRAACLNALGLSSIVDHRLVILHGRVGQLIES